MKRLRTFLAVDVDESLRQQVAKEIEYLSTSGADVKWVDPNQVHLTLKFLGEIYENELHEVCSAASDAAAESAGFQLAVRGLGAFPDLTRPRTLWMGLEDTAGQLASLHEAVEREFQRLGFRSESRQFHGHLTLGRVKSAARNQEGLKERIEQRRDQDYGGLSVDELTLYSSQLTRHGPIYSAVGHFDLKI